MQQISPLHEYLMPNFFRDYAFKFLYHLEDNALSDIDTPNDIEILLDENLHHFETTYFAVDEENPCRMPSIEEKEKALSLIKNALLGYKQNLPLIEKTLAKRTFAKLDKTVSRILLLGTTELLQKAHPFKVIINEYILVAKKYGQEDSFTLINGVLDAIAKKS